MQKTIFTSNWFLLAGIAGLILFAGWIGRINHQADKNRHLQQYFSGADHTFSAVNSNKWQFWAAENELSGFIYSGTGKGYNGPLEVIIQTDTLGIILSIVSVLHSETPSYYEKLNKRGFFSGLLNKQAVDFLEGNPVDIVSGATLTSEAVVQAIRQGYAKGEGIQLEKRPITAGATELFVIVLLLSGWFLSRMKNSKTRKLLLSLSLVLSAVILGFVFNIPITLARFTTLLLGYLPEIGQNMAVLILLSGSILLTLFTGKNIYCHSVCPFGATQEGLAKLAGAKPWQPTRHKLWKKFQWGATLIILLAALCLGNPNITQYEVFGAVFKLTGSTLLLIGAMLVVLASLFVKRFWCRFLCPVDGVFAYIKLLRGTLFRI